MVQVLMTNYSLQLIVKSPSEVPIRKDLGKTRNLEGEIVANFRRLNSYAV